jgi:PHD/YefM family antitoxin component YafN of YafNO toxin-antitoxin module
MTQTALESTDALPTERSWARTVRAAALASADETEEAARTARHALDEARRMGADLMEARAAAVLLSLQEHHHMADLDEIRARGKSALERLLEAVPRDRRTAVRARKDVGDLIAKLSLDLETP